MLVGVQVLLVVPEPKEAGRTSLTNVIHENLENLPNKIPGRRGPCDDGAVVIRPRLLVHDEGAVVAAAGSHRVRLVVRLMLPEVSLPDLRAQL